MSLRKSMYEHLKTYKKYNRLEILYQGQIEITEERTNERDAQIKINNTLEKKFNERIDELTKKIVDLKLENKELKKRRKK